MQVPVKNELNLNCRIGAAMPDLSAQPGFADESDLIARAKRGDDDAFTQLVDRYERKIFRLAKNITRNKEDAEDVLQNTFLKASEHLAAFQEQSKFYTWLVRITVNEALMQLRKRRSGMLFPLDYAVETGEAMVAREIAVWDANPEEQYSQEELRLILQQAIDGLSPIFRTVFTLRDVDELTSEETASALGISVPATKSRLLRARLQLRDKLTRYFERGNSGVAAAKTGPYAGPTALRRDFGFPGSRDMTPLCQ